MLNHSFKMMILTVASISFLVASTQASSSTLKVSVYYESLCPDSKAFITTQLYPAYQILSDYLTVEFVPFGIAFIDTTEDGALNFTCQHGPGECYGNEIQACAISIDPKNSLNFVDCAMASDDASDDALLAQCADSSKISWDSIDECITSGKGDQLLIKNGNATDALEPHLSWVPSVTFNGIFNPDVSVLATENFFDVVCVFLMKPKECLEKLG